MIESVSVKNGGGARVLEIPESQTISEQLNRTVKGKRIRNVKANVSPHKFAFYYGDPEKYNDLLAGKAISGAHAVAGQVEIAAEDARVLFSDGINVRYYERGAGLPLKYQLRMECEDESSIVCSVQMYGGLWAFSEGGNDNPYYLVAKEKPSPLSDAFDESYFDSLLTGAKSSLSAKAFLATEQRIPGLGNGALQDILFNAGINPQSKLDVLSAGDKSLLFACVKQTLLEMTAKGGRDTEKDLFGNPGGYRTRMSNIAYMNPCPKCGGTIVRKAYMGGNVYFCPMCQPVRK